MRTFNFANSDSQPCQMSIYTSLFVGPASTLFWKNSISDNCLSSVSITSSRTTPYSLLWPYPHPTSFVSRLLQFWQLLFKECIPAKSRSIYSQKIHQKETENILLLRINPSTAQNPIILYVRGNSQNQFICIDIHYGIKKSMTDCWRPKPLNPA